VEGGVYGPNIFPFIQLTVSRRSRKHKALAITSRLASIFIIHH